MSEITFLKTSVFVTNSSSESFQTQCRITEHWTELDWYFRHFFIGNWYSLFTMANLGLWQKRKKNTLYPIKSKQTGETLALSCKWSVQEANLFALSYLIHSSPRHCSERQLGSNPLLLFLHPFILYVTPSPPIRLSVSCLLPLLCWALLPRWIKSQSVWVEAKVRCFGELMNGLWSSEAVNPIFVRKDCCFRWGWKMRIHFCPSTCKY